MEIGNPMKYQVSDDVHDFIFDDVMRLLRFSKVRDSEKLLVNRVVRNPVTTVVLWTI